MALTIDDITISYADIKSPTPARCNRKTGNIWLNVNVWAGIEPAHRVFIILHEMAHIILNTSDELKVDEWAQKQYIAQGYPLTESVRAITSVLHSNSTQSINRGERALQFAKNKDKVNMNNTNNPLFSWNNDNYDGDENFLGLGKHAKEKRAIRLDKKRAKVDNIRSRGIARVGKVDVAKTLADQGIDTYGAKRQNTRNMVAGLAGAATSITAGIFGAGEAGAKAGEAITNAMVVKNADGTETELHEGDTMPAGATPLRKAKAQKKSFIKTPAGIAVIVVASLAIISGIVYFIKKKK